MLDGVVYCSSDFLKQIDSKTTSHIFKVLQKTTHSCKAKCRLHLREHCRRKERSSFKSKTLCFDMILHFIKNKDPSHLLEWKLGFKAMFIPA